MTHEYPGAGVKFSIPLTCRRSAEIRELVGFGVFVAKVRQLQRQTGLGAREIVTSAHEAGLVDYEEDQLEALLSAIGPNVPHYTQREGAAKLATRVAAREGCRAPAGTPGVVALSEQLTGPDEGYKLGVQWRPADGSAVSVEWFTREEYERLVEEVPNI